MNITDFPSRPVLLVDDEEQFLFQCEFCVEGRGG